MTIFRMMLWFIVLVIFLALVSLNPILFVIFLSFALLYFCLKATGKAVNIVSNNINESNLPPYVVEELKKARKMNNAELARAIREEDDENVKNVLKKEFFSRGNTKKDIYNL